MVRRLISPPFWVMGAWTAMLLWLAFDDRYLLFLAPKFRFFLFFSAALSMAFALGIAPRPGRDLTKGLFLLLPLIFILLAGDGTLDNFALSKRSVTPVKRELTDKAPQPTPAASPEPDQNLPGSTPPLISISQLVRNLDQYNGKRVSVEGLFSVTVVSHDELSAVFRYLITCCAADAMPVGVFIPARTRDGIRNNDWVRATGTVRPQQLDGFDIIMMDAPVVEKRDKPSKSAPYIYN